MPIRGVKLVSRSCDARAKCDSLLGTTFALRLGILDRPAVRIDEKRLSAALRSPRVTAAYARVRLPSSRLPVPRIQPLFTGLQ
jgi:hypothetical protein